MKTVYIPAGETVHYESLATERLVVRGCLHIDGSLKVKTIIGGGIVHAGAVSADVIVLDDLETASVVCSRLIAKRVQAPEIYASESAAISCFLSAACVKTGKLTVAISEVDEVDADEVVHLAAKKRTLFGTLLASALQSFRMSLTAPHEGKKRKDIHGGDAGKEAPAGGTGKTPRESPTDEAVSEPVDEERNRVMGLFDLCRESGYTLRIIPGTPEENAPKFDFAKEKIIRPAA